MLWNSVAAKTVEEIYRDATSKANFERKQDAQKRLNFYRDNQYSYIVEQLQKNFTNYDKLTPCFVNIVKKVVKNLAMVYLKDAKRDVEGSGQDKDIFAEIADSAALSTKMKMASRYAKLLKTVLLRPVWRSGKMDLDILTPDVLDVTWGDTPEDLQSVLITHYPESGRKDEVEYSLWTADELKRLDYRGNVIASEPNPYKVLPFVVIWDHMPTDEFWLSGGDDLISLQEAINEKLTDLLYVLRMQGFGVPWMKGADTSEYLGPEKAFDLTLSPGNVVHLFRDGEFGFAQAQAPINDTVGAIDKIIKWAAVTNGLPASSLSTEPTEESGVSKIVSNRELDELRRDDVALFASYEKKLFDLFKAVWNVHTPAKKLSENATLKVDFYDPALAVSPDRQMEVWDYQLQLGVISKVDIVMQMNPDLATREEAMDYLLKVQDEQSKMAKVLDEGFRP